MKTIPQENQYGEADMDLSPYFAIQDGLKESVIRVDELPQPVQYVAGTDVAYDDISQKMVGAIVVLDVETLAVVDKASFAMDAPFPYIPGLFSFREVPPLLEAFKQLKIKPDLIVCDAQGIAHPKGVGMATHLGIELDVPTIGCAKKRLIGSYDKEMLGVKRGAFLPLAVGNETLGVALRTQNNTNPMFVSIGHKISLETAIAWVLKLTPSYRLPETTRQADQLVNLLLKG